MRNQGEGITVTIMGKEFMVACPERERDALRAAADLLDAKMREIHASGKVIGAERAAIMAALNLAHELLDLRRRGGLSDDVAQKLRFLQNKIDAVLRH